MEEPDGLQSMGSLPEDRDHREGPVWTWGVAGPQEPPEQEGGAGALQEIFLTQGWNLHLLGLLALGGRFFTTKPQGKPNVHSA